MLSIAYIKSNTAEVIARLEKKRFKDAAAAVQQLLALDEQRRKAIAETENLRAEMNAAAKAIGNAMAQGKKEEAEALKAKTAAGKQRTAELETQMNELQQQFNELLVTLPNTPHESVPVGAGADDNTLIPGPIPVPTLPEGALCHWDLAAKHQLINFELGVKITGAGFPVYTGKGARLQRALISFFLDSAEKAGYREIQPPILVNADSGFGTGQLPDKEGQMYYVGADNLYLIPTAEVPITNLYRDVILDEAELPVKMAGYTPCFRREAGSYGKDVRGLNRLHQFDKVEIVQLTTPEKSYETLEQMHQYVCGLLAALELPYRTAVLCGGDMSFASAKTYDLEVMSAAQDRWLEVSSVSNFEDFQANRLKLRYRAADGRGNIIAHTLNGSALALPRIVACLLENNQQPDGSIRIPKALVPYTGFDKIG